MTEVYGYKVFNPDWTCRGFQYEVGKTYEMKDKPICCRRGFHFCEELKDCFSYYDFNPNNKVAKIIAFGEIDKNKESDNENKCCTNKIQIVEEISWENVLRMVNVGCGNTGRNNTGSYNTGNSNINNRNTGDENYGGCNTGDRNYGNYNTGDCNYGHYNTGDYNTGSGNAGWYNTGHYNTGWYNTGHYNSGDWNKTDRSNGCFNTEEPKIFLFNKPSDWTHYDWEISEAKRILDYIPKYIIKFVPTFKMTEDEKRRFPEHTTTGGYLKYIDNIKDSRQAWWDSLEYDEQEIIKAIPNFDPDIFYECTGIKVD